MGAWLIRGAAVAAALYLFMQWQGIGAPWIGLCMWLLCGGGAELVVQVGRVPDRRHTDRS